jgi:rSAM/selenodomain-associated transferase 1
MNINAVAVLARAPIAGEAKTRMMPSLSADEAATLQHACIATVVERFSRVSPRSLWTAGEHAIWADAARSGWTVHRQCDEDLGRRMMRAVDRPGTTVVVGTDSPDLPQALIETAAAAVESGAYDVAFVPAEDGGFCLLASRRLPLDLFDGVTWSAPSTLVETLERLESLHKRVFCTAPWYDLDTVADLDRLRIHYGQGQAVGEGFVPRAVLAALVPYYERASRL